MPVGAGLADSGRVDEWHALARVPHQHGVVERLAPVLDRLQQRVLRSVHA